MSLLSRFQTIDEADKASAVKTLVERATPDFDFFLMLLLAVFMASFGLIAGNETVIIGSMLLAPILYPILGVALGVSMSDPALLRRSLFTILRSGVYTIVAAAVIAFIFAATRGGAPSDTTVIRSWATPSLLYVLVAIVSGVAVAYAMVRPKLSESLPGVAISLSLLPPLSACGVGIAWLNPDLAAGGLAMFFINVAGVIAAGSICFSLMNVHGEKHIAHTAIAKEEKRVEKENSEIKKADEALEKPLEPAHSA